MFIYSKKIKIKYKLNVHIFKNNYNLFKCVFFFIPYVGIIKFQ